MIKETEVRIDTTSAPLHGLHYMEITHLESGCRVNGHGKSLFKLKRELLALLTITVKAKSRLDRAGSV